MNCGHLQFNAWEGILDLGHQPSYLQHYEQICQNITIPSPHSKSICQ